MDRTREPVVNTIAEWVCSLSGRAIAENVREVATTCLIDTLGVGLAGSRTSVAEKARSLISETSAAGLAEVLGGSALFSAPAAAFANACASHALDFDDNSYAAFVHGSAVIIPAVLAVSQQLDLAGDELLTGIIAGSEAQYAVGVAATNSIYDRGWWTTGVFGPIGASASAAYLMKLTPKQTANALGIAIAATGGMKACCGTDAKALMAGKAAEAGVVAALLAARGVTGPCNVIESTTGFSHLFTNSTFQIDRLQLPGETWRLLEPGVDVKRIPVCFSSHAAVEAVLDLVDRLKIEVSQIRRIECDVPPIVVANLIYDKPTTGQQAQFSIQYAIAASLYFGKLSFAELEPEAVNAPAIRQLINIIDMVSSDYWNDLEKRHNAPEGAFVRLTLSDGRQHGHFQAFPRGAASEPLSSSEIDDKFLACAVHAGFRDASRLLSKLRSIRDLKTTRHLLAAACMN